MSLAIAGLLSFSCISFLVGLGFQVSGYTNLPLAITLWLLSAILAIIAATVWIRKVRQERQTAHTKATIRLHIDGRMVEGKGVLEELTHTDNTIATIERFTIWRKQTGELMLRKNMMDDYAIWFSHTHVLATASVVECIQACEKGLNHLEAILKR